jgi:2-dehydropantoate 2-reductase
VATPRFIIYGSGAIGGGLGALLQRAGHQVVFIARGAHLASLRSSGLQLVTQAGTETIAVQAVASPADAAIASSDVVLLAMKGNDTEAALDELEVVADPQTPVVCVQNGVANELAALRRFANVYGVCVMFPAAHLEPGVVQLRSWPVPAILDVGRYPAGVDETTAIVANAFRSAGCHSVSRQDIMRWKYSKLLANLVSAVDAIAAPSDTVTEIINLVRTEGEEVLTAAGISFASAEEDRVRRGDILRVSAVNGARGGGSSSWQSLARGTGSIESDYLNGEIVLLGRLHGVPTPANEVVRRLANRLAREGRPASSLSDTQLRAAYDAAIVTKR